MKSLEEIEAERMTWSLKVFPEATAVSSLLKAADEILELTHEICARPINRANLVEEYTDVLMCLFDSLGRSRITAEELREAYRAKFEKNKARKWKMNADNTYSHVKD